jgi:hypothetical protein
VSGSGASQGYQELQVAPKSRQSFLWHLGGDFLRVVAEEPIFAFSLFGRGDLKQLGSLVAVEANAGLFGSATPALLYVRPYLPFAAVALEQEQPQVISADGSRQWVAQKDVLRERLLRGREGYEEWSHSWASLGVNRLSPTAPKLVLLDVDQEGVEELLVLDEFLHLFRWQEGAWVPFQEAPLYLEGVPTVQDAFDVTGDGLLDLLLPRCYFKSLAQLTTPYYTNYFPRTLRSSGTGAVFFDADRDGEVDLVSSLLDSYHVFPSKSPDVLQMTQPAFTPLPYQDVVDFAKVGRTLVGFHNENQTGQNAQFFSISELHDQGGTLITSGALPEDRALRGLSFLEPSPEGALRFRQTLPEFSRTLTLHSDGTVQLISGAFSGVPFDLNGDGLAEQFDGRGLRLGAASQASAHRVLECEDRTVTTVDGRLFRQARRDRPQDETVWLRQLAPGSAAERVSYEATAQGGFVPGHRQILTMFSPGLMERVDIDLDGVSDLRVVGTGVTWYRGLASGFESSPRFIHGPDRVALLNGRRCDLNGNAWADCLGTHPSGSRTVRLILDYEHHTPIQLDFPWRVDTMEELTLLDVNQDGLVDVLQRPAQPPAVLYLNQGKGVFETVPFSSLFTAVAPVDYTGDGIVDWVGFWQDLQNQRSWMRFFRLEQRTWQWDYAQELPGDRAYIGLLGLDLDLDGLDDLLATSRPSEEGLVAVDAYVLRWRTPLQQPPMTLMETYQLAGLDHMMAQDFNRDGFLDLAIRWQDTWHWYLHQAPPLWTDDWGRIPASESSSKEK